jgi:hypothetical protein
VRPRRGSTNRSRVFCGPSAQEITTKRVALRERPEADRRDPEVNVLAGLGRHLLLQVDPDPHRAGIVTDVGPGAAVGDDAVTEGDQASLGQAH